MTEEECSLKAEQLGKELVSFLTGRYFMKNVVVEFLQSEDVDFEVPSRDVVEIYWEGEVTSGLEALSKEQRTIVDVIVSHISETYGNDNAPKEIKQVGYGVGVQFDMPFLCTGDDRFIPKIGEMSDSLELKIQSLVKKATGSTTLRVAVSGDDPSMRNTVYVEFTPAIIKHLQDAKQTVVRKLINYGYVRNSEEAEAMFHFYSGAAILRNVGLEWHQVQAAIEKIVGDAGFMDIHGY
jgi:hypothetical protein